MDNYPMMSASELEAAPWNQEPVPEREFEVTITQTFDKTVKVNTDDYAPEYDEEDGHTYANTENTDWQQVYTVDHNTIPELLEVLKEYIKRDLETDNNKYSSDNNKYSKQYLEYLLKECEGWVEVETVITE